MARFWAIIPQNTLMENQFDPRMEFWKKTIDFLYKQAPAIVISFCACLAMGVIIQQLWNKNEERFAEIKQELVETKAHLRMCEEKREELSVAVARLSVKVDILQSRR